MAQDTAQLFLNMALNAPASIKRNLTGLQTLNSIGKGSIIQFSYSFAKHDPKPLVLLTDTDANFYKGLNLHYLFNGRKSKENAGISKISFSICPFFLCKVNRAPSLLP